MPGSKDHLHALCALALNPGAAADAVRYVAGLDDAGRAELLKLADAHHVIIRAVTPVAATAATSGESALQQWAEQAIAQERARIASALPRLHAICTQLEAAGCPATVMKSLDHWPDLGNDLDLYTTAGERRVIEIMVNRFEARIEPQSWCDRLANKWNFAVPGMRELVEVHSRRLGQTGEHVALARRFVSRRVEQEIGGYRFFLPAPEERIIVATLQRMYRHFYFRVCDLANSAALVETGALDYAELKKAAELGGIWPGVASYLVVVSDFVKKYRSTVLNLPAEVRTAARFGGEKVFSDGKFLRVPIMPYGAALYTEQVTRTALRGDVPATFRLSLLPTLAASAAVAYRITGSDKGVW